MKTTIKIITGFGVLFLGTVGIAGLGYIIAMLATENSKLWFTISELASFGEATLPLLWLQGLMVIMFSCMVITFIGAFIYLAYTIGDEILGD